MSKASIWPVAGATSGSTLNRRARVALAHGCRRCQDVCPVGADYEKMLKDALDAVKRFKAQLRYRFRLNAL